MNRKEILTMLEDMAVRIDATRPRTGYDDTDEEIQRILQTVSIALNDAINDIDWTYDDDHLNRQPYKEED
jgi:hypothetical protein